MPDKLSLSKRRFAAALLTPIILGLWLSVNDSFSYFPDWADRLAWLIATALETVLLWPLLRRWPNIPMLLVFAPLAGAAGLSLGLQTFKHFLFDPILESHALSGPLFCVAVSLSLGLLLARLANSEQRNSIRARFGAWLKQWLRTELGEWPGAAFMIALWGAALLIPFAMFERFTLAMAIPLGYASQPRPLGFFDLLLPFALVVAGLHQFVVQPGARKLQVIKLSLWIGLAVIAYWLPSNLLFLPRLLGADLPDAVFKLASNAWPLVNAFGVFSLAASRRHKLPVGLKIMMVGISAGAALSILLAYPVYAWTFNTFVPTFNYSGSAHNSTLLVGGFLAALVLLIAGPLAVVWTRPGSRWGKFSVGAVTGAIAGGILFGLLAAPAAGVAAQSALYGAAVSRVGYTDNEWVLKLAIATVSVFPTLLGVTWLLIGGGVLVGGLTGVFTPTQAGAESRPAVSVEMVLAELSGVVTIQLMGMVTMVVVVTILALLGPADQNVFDAYGVAAPWPTEWMMLGVFLQFWLISVLWQALMIVWVRRYLPTFIARQPTEARRRACQAQNEVGIYILISLGLALPVFLYLIAPDAFSQPVFLTANLIMVVLSLELFMTWQTTRPSLEKEITNNLADPDPEREPAAGSPAASPPGDWPGVGLIGGLFTGILNYQFITMALSLVLVSVVLVTKLADETGPALGVEWLRHTALDELFTVASVSFPALIFGYTLVGLSFSWVEWGTWFEEAGSFLKPFLSGPTPQPDDRWGWLKALWRYARSARLLGGLLLMFAAVSPFISIRPLIGVACAAAGAFLAMRAQNNQRFSWPVLVGAFGLSWAGLIVFTALVPEPTKTNWFSSVVLAVGIVTVGIAVVVMSRAVMAYTPPPAQQRVRFTALLCLTVLFGFFRDANQNQFMTEGGVSRYDGRRWEAFTAQNSKLGNRLNYQIFADGQGRLWFGGNNVVVGRAGEAWESHYVGRPLDSSSKEPLARAQQLSAVMRFVEDNQARLWLASDNLFGQFDPGYVEKTSAGNGVYLSLRIPKQSDETRLDLPSPISGLTSDNDGNIWVTTRGSGVLRLEGHRPVDDARWEFFTQQGGFLFSDDVTTVYADQAGTIWVGFPGGVGRFHEKTKTWDNFFLHGLPQSPTVTKFFQDSQGRLWLGTNQGLYRWVDETFLFRPELGYWPLGASANTFFEDSQGGLWVGTSRGALRLGAGLPLTLVPDASVTVFAEAPAGIIWIGTPAGLIRYDLATKQSETFDATNSGLATNEVRDLYADEDGGLWVSTFAFYQTGPFSVRTPVGDTLSTLTQPAGVHVGTVLESALALGIIFLGLFVYTYRGYQRTPETRAQTLARRLTFERDSLYPTAYTLLAKEPDAPEVLHSLSQSLARSGDQTGAQAIDALGSLAMGSEPEPALQRSTAALKSDSRAWGKSLHDLHHLLASALAARRIPEIVGLELAVNPGPEAGSITLSARDHSVESLPAFLPPGTPAAWRALERVGIALRKYQDVDTAADRLSYLAQALAEVEKAQSVAQAVEKPESAAMVAIVERWHTAITDEINLVSGRAELRLELRTRQARRAAEVTVALRLQNTGRAAAENVTVELQPSAAFTLVGEPRVALERLPSGRSLPVEFTLAPGDVETARLVCRLSWDDRVTPGNTAEFADVVRFYEVAEEFRRIPNPYIVGHPVKSPAMFQGRDDIFQFIQDNLSGPMPDRTLVLHGQRRTGKTSILYQLLDGRLGPKFIPVLIDMQELALLINSTGDFFNEVGYQLARAARKAGLAIEPPALEAFTASPTRAFNRFLDTFEEILGDRRVVVMFDEFELIEDKIAEGKLDPNLLGYFRSLMQHRDRLVFIFTGTHRLEEMSHDYWSILFNIALYRHVSFLSPADAARLIRTPSLTPSPTPPSSVHPERRLSLSKRQSKEPMGEGLGGGVTLDVDELAVEKIISLTRGHPYFVQLLGWALVNRCNAQARNYATINDVNDAVQEILTTGEAHFAYLWQQANAEERLALTALAHSLRPGKEWARPTEILETLAADGVQLSQPELVAGLDRLVRQDVLESATDGALRYRFQLEVLRLWIEKTKTVTELLQR